MVSNAGPEDEGRWKFKMIYQEEGKFFLYEHDVMVNVEGIFNEKPTHNIFVFKTYILIHFIIFRTVFVMFDTGQAYVKGIYIFPLGKVGEKEARMFIPAWGKIK